MLKHGIDQLSALGTSEGPSWAQALVSPRMSLKKFPSQYGVVKNIVTHSKHDASYRLDTRGARYHLCREHSHSPKLSKSYNKNKMVVLPFRLRNIFEAYFAIFSFAHYIKII